MQLADLLVDVLPRVASIAVFIALGLFVANLLVSLGAVERVAGLARYLTGPANLPDEVGTAILATTASPTAGYGMLAEFREAGLSDRATLVAVTINTFFGFVQHIFTFYAPVLIPILGLEVGLMYVGARAAISLAITATGIVAGALLLEPEPLSRRSDDPTDVRGADAPDDAPHGDSVSLREGAREAASSTVSKLASIVPRLAFIYTAVVWLTATSDLTAVAGAADPLVEVVGLPAAAVPVIAVFALDTTSGALTIAPMLGSVFTPRQAVATMLLGGVVSFAVSTFKRSIPFQYGVWGASFGSRVVALNTGLKIVFIGVALVLLLAP